FLTKAEVFLAASIAITVGTAMMWWLSRTRVAVAIVAFVAAAITPVIVALLLLKSAGLTGREAMLGIAGSWRWLGDRQLLTLPFFRDLSGVSHFAQSAVSLALV